VCAHLVEVFLSSSFNLRLLRVNVRADLDQTLLGDLGTLLPGDEGLLPVGQLLLPGEELLL
jgi:hypothetical protein